MLAAYLSYLPKWITQNALARHAKTSSFLKSRDHLSNHRGYGSYRSQAIREAINAPFRPEQLPAGHGRWVDERVVEYPWLFAHLLDGRGELLDA